MAGLVAMARLDPLLSAVPDAVVPGCMTSRDVFQVLVTYHLAVFSMRKTQVPAALASQTTWDLNWTGRCADLLATVLPNKSC